MNALVFGDSQAQGAGAVLQSLLEDKGYTVTRKAYQGLPTYKLLEKIPEGAYDEVYIFAGGNNSPGDQTSAVTLAKTWPYAKIIWFLPFPATYISDLALAQKVFGSNVQTTDHWLSSGLAAKRDQVANQLAEALASVPNVAIADVRKAYVDYPIQPDGIHMSAATAKECLPGMIASAQLAAPKKESGSLLTLLGIGAATAAFTYLLQQSRRNPAPLIAGYASSKGSALQSKRYRNIVLGVTGAGVLALLLWPRKAKAPGRGTSLLDIINPDYVPKQYQKSAVVLIDQMFFEAGYPIEARAAAVANAYAESGLNTNADTGDGGHAVGLFQYNDMPNAGGYGMSVEDRKDPVFTIKHVLMDIGGNDKKAAKFKALVDSGERDLRKLTYDFCVHFERPQNAESKGKERAEIAAKMFPTL